MSSGGTMAVIVIVIIVLLFVYLQYKLYDKFWNEGLNTRIFFSKKMAEENESFEIVEFCENNKRLPVAPLKLKYNVDKSIEANIMAGEEAPGVSDKLYYIDAITLGGFREVERSLKCHANKRGVFFVDQVFRSAHDICLLHEMHDIVDTDASIMIYPRHLDTGASEYRFNNLMGDITTRIKYIEDPFEYRGMREYMPEDGMKHVNWKASARADRLIVNEFNQTTVRSVKIAVNFNQVSIYKEDELLEESLRLAVSIAANLLSEGFSVEIVTNAKNLFTGEEAAVTSGSGYGHMESIHEAAASIDANAEVTDFTETYAFSGIQDTDDYVILISFDQSEKLCAMVEERINEHKDTFWIIPENYRIEYRLPIKLRAYTAEWRLYEN
jgi:hypothetical protein